MVDWICKCGHKESEHDGRCYATKYDSWDDCYICPCDKFRLHATRNRKLRRELFKV